MALDACRVAELSKEYSKILEKGETVHPLRDQMKCGKGFQIIGARWIKGEKVSKGVKSWRTTAMKMKFLCTTCIIKKQRDANIAMENIKSASRIVLCLMFQCMAKVKVNVVETESEREYCLTLESMDEGDICYNKPWICGGEVSARQWSSL